MLDSLVLLPGAAENSPLLGRRLRTARRLSCFLALLLLLLRCFDVVFKDVTDENKLHNRFLQFYDEFEGDYVACLVLHNKYVMTWLVAEGKASKQKPKKTLFAVPGDLLVTKKLKTFVKILTYCSK